MPDKPTALVTGASRGIGRGIAVRLAEEGYDVAFCFRSGKEAADETREAVERAGARCFHDRCDVTDIVDVKAFVSNAEAALGPVEVLVNNAGITRDNPLVLMPPEDWNDVIGTNLTGTYNFSHCVAFGQLKRRSGVIVNVSSVAGVYGNATQSNYAASKAGVNILTRSLSRELGPYGIRVNAVAPGFIETDMTGHLSEKVRKKALATIPLRDFGAVSHVADLVSFLVSDKASYITGQIVQVDGGFSQ
ncbi:3-oxoacyl-[acyl-carrier-protein] reductase [Streptomyces sp. NBC_00038]|uniref:3-oxoacyl-[acyl-carrier-protein] reductase n=1 Tax=Streptomyces sp. NBC_00038 TaxID=2903615 RepID=UPI00225A1E1F|nr:3-oxoacyl-[acyl-carrier-protein] reductase [Streptomyces sp. NBC_00038]MCX5555749.1 3-oxoacyl-[acyl-carrier-protein] reductase [Streptomyces sp. NBC_00038]